MKSNTVENVCHLPVAFKTQNKSAYTLAKQTNFETYYKDITARDISNYLILHPELVSAWQIFSEDKRSIGLYLLIEDNMYKVGELDKNVTRVFEKTFNSEIDACSEYIIREMCSLLNLEVNPSSLEVVQ